MEILDKRLFIFDYDGTLADTSSLHQQAFKKILEPFNLVFNYNDIAGMKTIDAINFVLMKNDTYISENKLIDLASNKQSCMKELILSSLNPIKGVDEFLSWSKNKFNLSIASSGSRKNVKLGLKKLGYITFFNHIICAEDVIFAKPNPEIFIKVLRLNSLDAHRALIFEDSNAGISAAKMSKIDCIDIRTISFTELLKRFKSNEFRF